MHIVLGYPELASLIHYVPNPPLAAQHGAWFVRIEKRCALSLSLSLSLCCSAAIELASVIHHAHMCQTRHSLHSMVLGSLGLRKGVLFSIETISLRVFNEHEHEYLSTNVRCALWCSHSSKRTSAFFVFVFSTCKCYNNYWQ